MTALIVIASIILFFAIILNIKVRAEIGYYDGKLDVKVKYLFFTIYPMKKRDKPKKQNKKRDKKTEEASDDTAAAAETVPDGNAEETVSEITEDSDAEKSEPKKKKKEKKESSLQKFGGIEGVIEKVQIIWGFTGKRLKKIFTHIYLEKLVIDFVIAGDDAHKTAVTYGAVNAAVYNMLAAVRALFKVSVKKISIVCDFDRNEPVYDCGVRITTRPSVVLSAGLGILWGFVRNYNKIIPKKSGQPEMNAAVRA